VVPEYNKLKAKYQLMWEQTDCVGYLKTAAVLAAYVDQSISTNTFYNPAHFPDRKVPATLIAKNLMLAHYWGLKTLYYSLVNKQGSKSTSTAGPGIADKSDAQKVLDELKRDQTQVVFEDDDDDCIACKL
jgi:ribonucleoside-diphosphate reductase alpha chain